jgi:hypothetical protein
MNKIIALAALSLFVQTSYAQQNSNLSAVDNFMSGSSPASQAASTTAPNVKSKTLNNSKKNASNAQASSAPVTTVVIPPRVASQTQAVLAAPAPLTPPAPIVATVKPASSPVVNQNSMNTNNKVAHAPVAVGVAIPAVPVTPSDSQISNTVKPQATLSETNNITSSHVPAVNQTTNANNGNSKAEDCVTPVIHKKVYHPVHKKVISKKHYVATPVPGTNTVVNNIDMSAPITIQPAYLNSSQVDIQITHPEKKIFEVSFVNKTTGEAVSHDQFVQLIDGSDFSAHSLDSRLTYIKSFNVDSDDKTTNFRFEDKKAGSCTGFYFTYHLKGDADITTRHIFVGSNNEVMEKSDGSCKLVQKHPRDFFGYNDDNYVTTLNWNDPSNTSDKPVRFQVMVTKDSQELFPQNLSAYAVSTDFSDFNYTLGKMDKRGPYFGSAFSMSLPANSYFMNISYEYDNGNKTELISVPTIVQQATK